VTVPDFKKTLSNLSSGKIVIPIIRAALHRPSFDGFEVPVEGWTPRPYDGWFHPSTHATWTVRQLWLYLTLGARIPLEEPELLFVLSVTQGKFWHSFVQKLMLDHGIMAKDEVPLKDPVHMRRGHTDGLLDNGELFEFKTASERVLMKIQTVKELKEYKPGYYAQTQEYLDIAGYQRMRYFIMTLAAPFPMEEFVVEADPGFQEQQRLKYRAAIEHAQTGEEPDFCCSIGSKTAKTCPTRYLCPIGLQGIK
jgi:hypothetical protein